MAWSRPAFTGPLALMLTAFLSLATAATITHDFNITWVTANPDGLMARPVIGINGQWPIPRIDVNVGDRLIINVLNLLGNQSTSLHFHGMYFAGQTHMDGSSQVSQCAIPPGSSFTYNFTVDQPGTYWYHSHAKGQYPDGLRGPFIVHDPDDPFRGQYDEEIVLTVSDWYHNQVPELIKFLMSKTNPTGAEPVPQSALMNDTQNLTVSVQPGKTYFFRMVNMGAFAGQYVWFEGHNITIVEVDGVYTQPKVANMLYIATAQRYSFLLTTRNDTSANFPFISSMDTSLFDKIPEDLHQNVTGWLSYNSANVNPEPTFVETYDFFDDLTLVAYDNQTMLGEPDQIITLNVMMDNLGDGANYAFFNNITYVSPKVPTVYTALSAGDLATDASVYGDYTNSYVLKKDQIVQVVVNNLDSGRHPFHLHGHEFQALYRSDDGAGTFDEAGLTESSYPAIPMRRDTLVLYPEGFFVFRFKASNPGVWLLHCHIEWHVVSGLIATFVENPLDLQKTLTVPQNHLDTCAAAGIPTKGNAAGNTQNYLDLTGQNAPPAPLPAGFTTRGIIAFVFSTLCGILGVATVAWYGFADAGEGAKGPAETNSSSGVRTPAASEMLEPMTPAAAGLVEVREEITVQSSAGRA